jgi:hypothetical protein
LICKHGILNHENLTFDSLIADKVSVVFARAGADQGRDRFERLPDRDDLKPRGLLRFARNDTQRCAIARSAATKQSPSASQRYRRPRELVSAA